MQSQETLQSVRVFLKHGKEEAVRRFHPWVFSGAIARVEGQAQDGDLAEVLDKQGNILGLGHFHHGSIAVRLLHFGPGNLQSPVFWVEKISTAADLRAKAGLPSQHTDCYRLVHGEGDGLSGLVIDVYGSVAVMQCHSIGMHRQRALICEALRSALGPALTAVYDKSAESLPGNYAKSIRNGYLWTAEAETPPTLVVRENDVQFRVDWETGQKTGFFLDQRDNRALLQHFVQGKSVLNTFCYTGGFSAYALRAGARLVHSVDVSAKAMVLTDENAALNGAGAGVHTGFTSDVPLFLKQTDMLYEVMVVDPPAFAKTLDKRHNAVQGYKRLNALAMSKVAPGGILFTFSCSQVIDRQLFYNTIVAAALEAGRDARVLHHLTQGADHPVSLFHPEGAYLKGLVLYIA